MSFVRAANPIWFFNNLTGAPLNDTYWAFFLTNDLPYVPQNVFQDPDGTNAWSDPIEFQPSGGLPNNLYFDPTLVYRIEIRQGSTQNDPLIWLIQNFVPGEGTVNIENSFVDSQNLITNPQFADISFSSPFTITTAGTYQIAPGWQLILTGAGSTTLTQIYLPAGSFNLPSNPTYALTIANTGWTTAKLIQQFNNNGALFANGSVSMSILAKPLTTSQLITLSYVTSDGVAQTVKTDTIPNDVYTVLAGAIDLPPSVSPDTGNSAFTQMQIILQPTSTITISNVQFIGQSVPLSNSFTAADIPPFEEISYERVVDQEFHYYKNSIIMLPKKSILTGWNFSLNPYQFITKTISTQTNVTAYAADQTIVHQEAASQINTGAAIIDYRGGFQVGAVTSATQTRFALIQYIDPKTILPYWSYFLSSLVKCAILTTHNTQIRLKMRLITRTGLPPTIGTLEPIASWPANSDPVFSAGWRVIKPLNDPEYIIQPLLTNSSIGTPFDTISFNSFDPGESGTFNDVMGVVVYTMDNMNSTSGSEDSIIFDKISLVPNTFAIETHPDTYDESLRQCQFYYEKSYNEGVLPGTAGGTNALLEAMNVSGSNGLARSFGLEYKGVKRTTSPSITFYATDGSSGNVTAFFRRNGSADSSAIVTFSSFWTPDSIGDKEVQLLYNSTSALVSGSGTTVNPECFISFQYTIDARLGL